MEGPARFTEIRGSVDGLSARLLAERLRELEAAGLMERRELPGGAVEYRLTAKGAALSRVVHEIEAWVDDWDAVARDPRRARRHAMPVLSDDARDDPGGPGVRAPRDRAARRRAALGADLDRRCDGDRLVMFTQTGSRKARNIEGDARVAISAVDDGEPLPPVRPARPGRRAHRRRGGPGGRRRALA